MTKVTFIGEGSVGFTRRLFIDILAVPKLQDVEQSLAVISHSGTASLITRSRIRSFSPRTDATSTFRPKRSSSSSTRDA